MNDYLDEECLKCAYWCFTECPDWLTYSYIFLTEKLKFSDIYCIFVDVQSIHVILALNLIRKQRTQIAEKLPLSFEPPLSCQATNWI